MNNKIYIIISIVLTYNLSVSGWKIINGTRTVMHQYPQIVSIQVDGDHICGGTLLNGNTVLTAAHCVWDMRFYTMDWFEFHQIKVVLGEYDLHHMSGKEKIFQVTKIMMHPTYQRAKGYIDGNDVAFMKFDGFISNNEIEYIKYTKLDTGLKLNPGERCEVVGWGSMLPVGEDTAQFLQKAFLDIVSTEECSKTYFNVQNVPSNICAGSGSLSISACKGDSGGPLFCRDQSNNPIQVGIVSYSKMPCGQANKPTVYTRISEVAKWIMSNSN